MTITEDNINLSKNYILKAKQTFKDAESLRNTEGAYVSVCNRLYYAAFYMVSAVLILKGLTSRKHSGVKSLFNLHFIKTGLINKEFGDIFRNVQQIRTDLDYEFFYVIDKETIDGNYISVEDLIKNLELFIENVINGGVEI